MTLFAAQSAIDLLGTHRIFNQIQGFDAKNRRCRRNGTERAAASRLDQGGPSAHLFSPGIPA